MSYTRYFHHLGIESLNAMQDAAIAALQHHRNLMLLSPTGSGKTLAFLLPLLDFLREGNHGIQALILVPSRELALQIDDVFRRLRSGHKVSCCYGGHDIRIEINNLIEPPVVLVGTPGRVLDHLRNSRIQLKGVRMLVLDEFDKCLDFGFADEMGAILEHLGDVQTRVLTSATRIEHLPSFTGVDDVHTLDFISQVVPSGQLTLRRVDVWQADKLEALLLLVCKLVEARMFVFLNHRDAVERVARYLNDHGVVNEIFHGGLDQRDRERTLTLFRNGSCRILITTDLAARGLDIPDIDAVIHYHLPVNAESWTHRNGRTARMGAGGTAYVLALGDEVLPDFIPDDVYRESLPAEAIIPPQPRWCTLMLNKGRKDKVNKVDVVGFFCQKGGLSKDNIGLIEVKDNQAYVAVSRAEVLALLKHLRGVPLKGRSVRIQML